MPIPLWTLPARLVVWEYMLEATLLVMSNDSSEFAVFFRSDQVLNDRVIRYSAHGV